MARRRHGLRAADLALCATGLGAGGRRFKCCLPDHGGVSLGRRRQPSESVAIPPCKGDCGAFSLRLGLPASVSPIAVFRGSSHAVRHAGRRVSAPGHVAYGGSRSPGRSAFFVWLDVHHGEPAPRRLRRRGALPRRTHGSGLSRRQLRQSRLHGVGIAKGVAHAAGLSDGHQTRRTTAKPRSFNALNVGGNRTDQIHDLPVHIRRELRVERVNEKHPDYVGVACARGPLTNDIARSIGRDAFHRDPRASSPR
jgi:hypothetical protein